MSGITDTAESIPLYTPFINLYLKSPNERDNDSSLFNLYISAYFVTVYLL